MILETAFGSRDQTACGEPVEPAYGELGHSAFGKRNHTARSELVQTVTVEETLPQPFGAIGERLKLVERGNLAAALQRLVAGGVESDRWTSPDLLGQVRQAARDPIDTILCGALDLDPVLPLQQELAATRALEITAGTAALAACAGAKQAMIALPEDSPPRVIAAMRTAAGQTGVRLFPLPNEYPLANGPLLIRRVLNRKLAPSRLPAEVDVLLVDSPAAIAAGRCLLDEQPMLQTPIGIYDQPLNRSHLFLAPVGARVGDVLAAAGMIAGDSELRAGHVLRDVATGMDAIVGGGELSLFLIEAQTSVSPAACLRCGWCVEACPARIHPAGLLEAAQQEDPELAQRYGVDSCIECGICSYVCPSRLPLLAGIRGLMNLKT